MNKYILLFQPYKAILRSEIDASCNALFPHPYLDELSNILSKRFQSKSLWFFNNEVNPLYDSLLMQKCHTQPGKVR